MKKTNLKIVYSNIEGLDITKFTYASNVLARHFAIVFLAETWHCDLKQSSHPFFVASSPLININHSGRQHGGILLLSCVKHLISKVVTHEFYILIKIAGLTVIGVYFPPRLKPHEIEAILETIPACDIILGDFNVRYGAMTGDSATSNPERRRIIEMFQNKFALAMIHPSIGLTRNDHVFSAGPVTRWEYVFTNGLRAHDHDTMFIETNKPLDPRSLPRTLRNDNNTPSSPPPQPHRSAIDLLIGRFENDFSPDVRRFNINCLNEPIISNMLANEFTRSSSSLSDTYVTALQNRNFESIDELDFKILKLVDETCAKYLGVYSPQEMRSKPDNFYKKNNLNELNTPDAIKMFKRLQRVGGKKHQIESRNPNTSPMEDTSQHFSTIFGSLPSRTFRQRRILQDSNDRFVRTIASAFTPEAISAFFKRYQATKSCGEDGIHTVICRSLLNSAFPQILANLFQLCASRGYTPRLWNVSLVYPLAKTSDSHTIDQFRPVALTKMVRRCFESILLHFLHSNPDTIHTIELNFAQAGFRAGQSCPQHILAADDFQAINSGPQIFIDLKSAYDRVSIDTLLEKLTARNIPVVILNIFSSLFSDCFTKVMVNGQLTEPIRLETGVFQGSLLSPLLFDLYIDDLANILNGRTPDLNAKALFYADDIRLAYPRNTPASVLQNDLNTIQHWAERNNMILSPTKSAVIWPREMRKTPLFIAGAELAVQTKYKYLGVEFHDRGIAWQSYIARITEKAEKLLSFLKMYSMTWRESLKRIIARIFVCPVYEYCFPLVYAYVRHFSRNDPDVKAQIMEPLNNAHKSLISWVFGGASFSKPQISIAAIPEPKDRMLFLATSFIYHLREASPTSVASLRMDALNNTLYVRRRIGRFLKQNHLSNEFDRLPEEEKTKERLAAFLKRKQNEKYLNKDRYGLMAQYAAPASRNASGMDRVLEIQDSAIRKKAIQWRLNRLCGLYCFCGARFQRDHQDHLHPHLAEAVQPFLRSIANWRTNPMFSNYGILDEFLNSRRYDLFRRAIAAIGAAK